MSKKVLIAVPSIIAARGLERIFSDLGEFEVAGILRSRPLGRETPLQRIKADVVIVDPSGYDADSALTLRSSIASQCDAAVLGFQSSLLPDEVWRQFDDVVGLYDEPTAVIKKVRDALSTHHEQPDESEPQEQLSQREKEVLVCVAKGMLNKEIADKLNLSIYTVITHRKNITRKTGIKTVAGLTVYALLNNLIEV